MAESEILTAIKSLQTHLKSQLLATNTTLQEFMDSVESRFSKMALQPPLFTPFTPGSSHTNPDNNPPFRSMKMEVPRFDGSDPAGWIFRIEEFFNFHNTPEATRLRIVSFHMDGPAAAWFQWMKTNHLLSTWPVFLHSMRHRFGGSLYEDSQGELSKLTQTSSVAEFQTTFENLMNKVDGISEPLLISLFISGLKSDIRRELSFSKPNTLMEAFSLAKAYEARLEKTRAESKVGFREPYKATPLQSVPPSSPPRITYPSGGGRSAPPLLPTPPLPIKKFSPQELREKREKGLCYNSDKKWAPGHRCRSKFLVMFGTDDEEEPDDESVPPDITPDDTVLGDISSLHTLSGLGRPRSLHLIGTIGHQQQRVLVDSGSTHNFIQPKVAQSLLLETRSVTPFRVYVGNGDYLICRHMCPNVAVTLQQYEFIVDFHVLSIEGPSLVLGIQWLQTLGPVTHDYAQQTMEFKRADKKITLIGDSSLDNQRISFSQLQALAHSDKVAEIFELII